MFIILMIVVATLIASSKPDTLITERAYVSNIFDWENGLRQGTAKLNGDYLADNWFLHDPQLDDRYGLDGYKDWVHWYHALMPDDFNYSVDGRETIDNLMAVMFTIRGTHTGELEDIPATGNMVQITGILFHRFENGKLVESWILYNRQRFLVQIGVEETIYAKCESLGDYCY